MIRQTIYTVIAMVAVTVASAQAATISWTGTTYVNETAGGSPAGLKDLTGTGQFDVSGILLAARNYGVHLPPSNENDTTLVGGGDDGSDIDFTTDGHAPLGWTQNNTAYHSGTANKVSAGGAFESSAGTKTLTIGTGGNMLGDISFEIGKEYRIQFLIYDGRGTAPLAGSTLVVDGVNYGSFATGVFGSTWGDGLLMTGTFTADGTTQAFDMEIIRSDTTSGGGQINAILIHAAPTPAALPTGLALIGLVAMRRNRKRLA